MIKQIYSDETTGQRNGFYIYTAIYGRKKNIDNFSQEIESIVKKHRVVLGNDFIEFKANRLSIHNMSSLGLVYEELFKALNVFLQIETSGYIISFYSKQKYLDNIEFLKKLIKKELDTGKFKDFFPTILESDYPAIYNRIDHLMLFLKYRDKYLEENEEIEFYPDSCGKILRYNNIFIKIADPKKGLVMDTTFFNGIRILANSICQWLRQAHLSGYPIQSNKITHYQPLDSKSSRLIQICDALSNFSFNAIKYLKKLESSTDNGKFFLLTKYLCCEEQLKEASNNFEISENKYLLCINDSLQANINKG